MEPQDKDYVLEGGERHRGNLIVHDLISLNCKLALLANQQDALNKDELAKHIVSIVRNGSPYTLPSNVTAVESFFTGGARFLKKNGDAWVEMSDADAVKLLVELMEQDIDHLVKAGYGKHVETEAEEDAAAAEEKMTGEEKDKPAADASPEKRLSPRRDKRLKNNSGQAVAPSPSTATAESKRIVTTKPNIDDVVLLDRKDSTEKTYVDHAGNAYLVLEVSQFFTDMYMLSTAAIKGTRADAALATAYSLLGPVKDVGLDGTTATKTRFLLRPEDSTFRPNKKEVAENWEILTYAQAAEFILMLLFDKLVDKENIAAILETNASSTDAASVAANTSAESTVPVKEFTQFDVLFGRGGLTNTHPGNRRFRDIILLHRPDYARAIKIEKPNVARKIVKAIRCGSPPGRFLKKDPKNGLWYDVGDKHAAEKTSQALREKTQAEKAAKFDEDKKKRLRDGGLSQLASQRGVRTYPILPLPALSPADLQKMVQSPFVPGTNVAGVPVAMGPYGLPYAIPPNTTASGDKSDVKPPPNGMTTSPAVAALTAAANGSSTEDLKPAADQARFDAEGNILVTDMDVISGRGGRSNHHQGNKRFRDIVALHRPDYVRAAKIHKPAVARNIVRALKTGDPPGRFLKKDEKTGKYFELSDKKAAEKVSQALREKTPDERERLKTEAGTMPPSFVHAAIFQATRALMKEVPGLESPPPAPATGSQATSGGATVTPVEDKPAEAASESREQVNSSPTKGESKTAEV